MNEILGLFGAAIIIVACFYVMARVVDDYFIESLDNIAKRLKLTPSVAGATLMAVGTSAPELSITLFSLFLAGNNPATGLGNVVGSAIFQILVVIGFASLVKTAYLNWRPVVRDAIAYLISVILLIIILSDGLVFFSEALLLVGVYFIYLALLIWWSRNFAEEAANDPDPIEVVDKARSKSRQNRIQKLAKGTFNIFTTPFDLIIDKLPDPEEHPKYTWPVFLLCLVAIAGLSYILVEQAEYMASILQINPAIIALTILAGGSSIPELISSYIISQQGRGDMAISNAVGSNIFDVLISLGLPLLIFTAINSGQPAVADTASILSSLFLLFATLIAVMTLLAVQKFKIGRRFGIILIGLYVIYVMAVYSGVLEAGVV